jgi:choline dehydrogenase
MHRFSGCTLVAIPCRPESRGWLRRPLAIQANYLATQADKDTIIAGLKVSRRVFATAAIQPYVTEEYMPGPQATTGEAC